jgi:glycolate oxidase FAD binding subunit
MAQISLDSLAQAATVKWGTDAARPAVQTDSIDAVAPTIVLEPPDATTLSEMLRWANVDKLSIVARGGGTKLSWGLSRGPIDAVLSTARLSGPVDHCAGDLTVTVPAGARLAAVNRVLAAERQWLALDPLASDRATIGGIVATNDSGPRRQHHGTPKDLIIGVKMVLPDGRTAKAGGRVVKNVAGYDLARLLCGSFGCLAVITSATFKLAPLAPASRTVVATGSSTRQLADLALAISAGPLTPTAIELNTPPARLLIRIETTEAAADGQAAAICDLCSTRTASASIVTGDNEATLWREHEDHLAPANETLVRLAVLPTQVAGLVEHVEAVVSRHELDARIGGRAALGVIYVLFAGTSHEERLATSDGNNLPQGNDNAQQQAAAIEELRRHALARGGSAVLVAASAAVKVIVDPWGEVGDGLPLMRSVKARFDPNGILNPGRGPGGI